MTLCPGCEQELTLSRLHCAHCGVTYSGQFGQSRLARLPAGMQHLAETVLLCGGNLKEVATRQDISYPTLRKRMDSLIVELRRLKDADDAETDRLLSAVEEGSMRPEQAARRIREMNHGS